MKKFLEGVLLVTIMPILAYCVYIDTPIITNIALIVLWLCVPIALAGHLFIVMAVPYAEIKEHINECGGVFFTLVRMALVQGTSLTLLHLSGHIWLMSAYSMVTVVSVVGVGLFWWGGRELKRGLYE